MNTKSLRRIYGYTQADLARQFAIPLGTVQNWDARNCMPDYIYRMMSRLLMCDPEIRNGSVRL